MTWRIFWNAALLYAVTLLPLAAQTITGSGSTFVFPAMARWTAAYQKDSGATVSYQPIGSSAGEREIIAGLTDFGVTDAPLVDAQLLRDGLAQFPIVMGAIVPVVNLDGIKPGQLHLPGSVLAKIYLGEIRRWRDPAILAANPEMTLPDKVITPIYRSDGSGTTFNWTSYLSGASPVWLARIGARTSVAWPIGAGAKGSRGMADGVAKVPGAIGYLEFSTASRRHLVYALADNRAGHYVVPDAEGFQAAVEHVDWTKTPDFAVVLTETTDRDAYPLMATSFVLIRAHRDDDDPTLRFFRWVLDHGNTQAAELNYVPLPAQVAGLVKASWVRLSQAGK